MKSTGYIFTVLVILAGSLPLGAQESSAGTGQSSLEEQRIATIRYGTEAELAGLIQTLKNEKIYSLDNELILLVQGSRNRSILSGLFSFFGERQVKGLEERALRVLDERDQETAESILAAIEYLGKLQAGGAQGILETILDRDESRYMNAAIKALGRIGKGGDSADEVARYLIDYYHDREPGNENQREIVIALGETGSREGVSLLAGIADNADERMTLRIAALESLAKIGDPAGLDAVTAALQSSDPNVRAAAVGALGPFTGARIDEVILEAFRDTYYRTRIGAAQAARERRLAAAVPYLRYRAERDEVPAVKEEAIRALGAIDTPESRSVLSELFMERKNSDRVRILAAEMLIERNADTYTDALIAELDEAKAKNLTALYNGFLRVLSTAKTRKIEVLARRFYQSGSVVEKSYALDMTALNELRGFMEEVQGLTDEKNGALARKAQDVLQKLGPR